MKVNTKVTDSLIEKRFAKFPFNYGKKLWCQIDSTKAFDFQYIHLFSQSGWGFGIFYLQGLKFYMTCYWRSIKPFCNFVSGANLRPFTGVIGFTYLWDQSGAPESDFRQNF